MRAAALDLCGLGWRLFPVAGDCRSPLIRNGCHAASCDPEDIERWWARNPSANVALACGPASGVLALDIDRKGEVDGVAALSELCREFEPLPRTVRNDTPSGGLHLLFAFPEGHRPPNRVGLKRYAADGSRRVYPGLDVRADGASICLPPSAKPSGPYRWSRSPFVVDMAPLPGWLLNLMLSEPPPVEVKPLRFAGKPERVARYVVAAVDGECRTLASMSKGSGRNQRLFIAAAKLGGLVGAGLLGQDDAEAALEAAARDCGLVSEDGLRAVRLTVASGIKRGVSAPREVAA